MFGLGDSILPESRRGLPLFFRKGMWTWGQFSWEKEELREVERGISVKAKTQIPLVQIFASAIINASQV